MTTQKPNLAFELFLLLMVATLWAGSYTFIKLGVATIPPITLIAGRTLIAGLLLLLIMRWRGIILPMDAAAWRQFVIQACLNSAVPFTLIAWAETRVDAALAGILNATTPIFTFLLTAFVTRHEPVTARKMLGVLIGLGGICLIIGVEALSGLGTALLAQLAVVAATICYAGAAIYGKNFKALDAMVPAAGSLIAGAALLIPFSLLIDRPWTLAPSAGSLWALLGLAVLSTAVAFSIYFRLLQTLGSVGATAQAYLRVPIAVLLAMLALGERPSSTAWLGLIFVLAGVVLMTLPARKG